MVFKPKNKVGYRTLGLVACTFAVFLLLNLTVLFNDKTVNLGSSTAVATTAPDGHWVWVTPSSGQSFLVCVCGPPYTCSKCKQADYPASHWEKIGGQWICVCGGSNSSSCGLCVARDID